MRSIITAIRSRLLVASLLLGGAGLGCDGAPSTRRETLNNWLTCVECTEGELDSVVALASRDPSIVEALRNDLLQGPSTEARARLTAQLEATYRRTQDYVARDSTADSLPFTESAFVERYLGHTVAIYQGRAARALGVIGGRQAREALDRALQLPPNTFPPSVLAQIQFARDSLLQP